MSKGSVFAEKDRARAYARRREVTGSPSRPNREAVSRRDMPAKKLTAPCDDPDEAAMIAARGRGRSAAGDRGRLR